MSSGHRWRMEHAAADLAQLLRMARRYLAETQPRRCADCGMLFVVPPQSSEQRCERCEDRQTD